MITSLPEQFCRKCRHRFTLHESINLVGAPKPGDVTLCIQCGTPHVFGDGLILRAPNSAEEQVIENDIEIQRLRATIVLNYTRFKAGLN